MQLGVSRCILEVRAQGCNAVHLPPVSRPRLCHKHGRLRITQKHSDTEKENEVLSDDAVTLTQKWLDQASLGVINHHDFCSTMLLWTFITSFIFYDFPFIPQRLKCKDHVYLKRHIQHRQNNDPHKWCCNMKCECSFASEHSVQRRSWTSLITFSADKQTVHCLPAEEDTKTRSLLV